MPLLFVGLQSCDPPATEAPDPCQHWRKPRLTFDKDSKSYEDLLGVHGFFQCLQHTLRLDEFGLLFGGVPCNSFTWISSSQHNRNESNGFMGNWEKYSWVELMNILATRAAICIAVALSRRCYFMVENPDRSTLPSFPYFDHLLQVSKILDIFAGVSDRQQKIFLWLICIWTCAILCETHYNMNSCKNRRNNRYQKIKHTHTHIYI